MRYLFFILIVVSIPSISYPQEVLSYRIRISDPNQYSDVSLRITNNRIIIFSPKSLLGIEYACRGFGLQPVESIAGLSYRFRSASDNIIGCYTYVSHSLADMQHFFKWLRGHPVSFILGAEYITPQIHYTLNAHFGTLIDCRYGINGQVALSLRKNTHIAIGAYYRDAHTLLEQYVFQKSNSELTQTGISRSIKTWGILLNASLPVHKHHSIILGCNYNNWYGSRLNIGWQIAWQKTSDRLYKTFVKPSNPVWSPIEYHIGPPLAYKIVPRKSVDDRLEYKRLQKAFFTEKLSKERKQVELSRNLIAHVITTPPAFILSEDRMHFKQDISNFWLKLSQVERETLLQLVAFPLHKPLSQEVRKIIGTYVFDNANDNNSPSKGTIENLLEYMELLLRMHDGTVPNHFKTPSDSWLIKNKSYSKALCQFLIIPQQNVISFWMRLSRTERKALFHLLALSIPQELRIMIGVYLFDSSNHYDPPSKKIIETLLEYMSILSDNTFIPQALPKFLALPYDDLAWGKYVNEDIIGSY